MLNPDMPSQELRLHLGEMTAQEERTAIRFANAETRMERFEIADILDRGIRIVNELWKFTHKIGDFKTRDECADWQEEARLARNKALREVRDA